AVTASSWVGVGAAVPSSSHRGTSRTAASRSTAEAATARRSHGLPGWPGWRGVYRQGDAELSQSQDQEEHDLNRGAVAVRGYGHPEIRAGEYHEPPGRGPG